MFAIKNGFFSSTPIDEGGVNLTVPRNMFQYNTSFGDTGGKIYIAGGIGTVSNLTFQIVSPSDINFKFLSCSRVGAGNSILAISTDNNLYALTGNSNIASSATSGFVLRDGSNDWAVCSVGVDHAAAIKSNGDLFMWGVNGFGQLGFNDSNTRTSPTKLGNDKWFHVSCGQSWTIGVKQDGTVWSWGLNGFGQLGLGNTTTFFSPQQITTFGNNGYFVQAGASSGWVMRQDGSILAGGDNGSGRLGLGNTTSPISTYTALSTQNTTNEYVYYNAGANHVYYKKPTSNIHFVNGLGSSSRLGTGTLDNIISPTQFTTSDWLQISAGLQHGAGIINVADNYGDIYTWGPNSNGRTGQNTNAGTTTVPTKPTLGRNFNIVYADCGTTFTAVISKD